MNIDDINTEKLRNDLIEYFGLAMLNASPVALINLSEIENASNERLVQIAIKNGFDLNDYLMQKKFK